MDGYGQQTPALADTHVEPMEKASCVLDKGPCGSDHVCKHRSGQTDRQPRTVRLPLAVRTVFRLLFQLLCVRICSTLASPRVSVLNYSGL